MNEKQKYDELYRMYMRQSKNELAAMLAKRDMEAENKPQAENRVYTMSVASL